MEDKIKTDFDIAGIAEYTLLNLFSKGISVCPLKLQKVLYYIQAWHMVYFDKALLFDEKPQAWVNGPVYRSVYDAYSQTGLYEQIEPRGIGESDIDAALKEKSERLSLSKSQVEFLESIYEHYGTMSHDKLVFLTHAEKPWSEAREGLSPFDYSHKELSLDTMYGYYRERLSKNREKQAG
jgi:uncharacterized phage-associated protein